MALPERVRDIANSETTTRALEEIGKKYKLHVDQIGELAFVVGEVFFGKLRPRAFSQGVAERLEISHTMANEITKDVNEAVFLQIQRELHNLYSEEKDTTAEGSGVEKEELLEAIEDTGVDTAKSAEPSFGEGADSRVGQEKQEKTEGRDELLRQIESPGESLSVTRQVPQSIATQGSFDARPSEQIIEQPHLAEKGVKKFEEVIPIQAQQPVSSEQLGQSVVGTNAMQSGVTGALVNKTAVLQKSSVAEVQRVGTAQVEQKQPSILEQKRSKPFNPDVAFKERINRDPYKESI